MSVNETESQEIKRLLTELRDSFTKRREAEEKLEVVSARLQKLEEQIINARSPEAGKRRKESGDGRRRLSLPDEGDFKFSF